MKQFLQKKNNISQIVAQTQTFLYMNSIMFDYMAKNSMKQIEEDENKILQELANNSNKSINEFK